MVISFFPKDDAVAGISGLQNLRKEASVPSAVLEEFHNEYSGVSERVEMGKEVQQRKSFQVVSPRFNYTRCQLFSYSGSKAGRGMTDSSREK